MCMLILFSTGRNSVRLVEMCVKIVCIIEVFVFLVMYLALAKSSIL